MGHATPEFETQDVLGKTRHFNGSVGTTPALVPDPAQGKITKVYVRNSNSNSFNKTLGVAFDGQLDYLTLQKGEWKEWEPKKNNSGAPITQIRIVGSEASVDYEILMDFEP